MNTLEFSADQEQALDRVNDWHSHSGQEFLTMGGYAGTGKTTLVSHLVEVWQGVATVALCGKAAHVLRAKGTDAQTLHSLIYVPFKNRLGRMCFRKRDYLPGVRTIIVDEASMIDHTLLQDLLSFRIPILFVGDHGQLEPIGTNPKLMVDPKVRLENIHRQAMGNPILRLATAFREGRTVPHWSDKQGKLSIISRSRFHSLVSPSVQMICGYNKTRHAINRKVREILRFTDKLVMPGEKLICLRNNKQFRIFNGQQVKVLDVVADYGPAVRLEVETDDGRCFSMPCLKKQFGIEVIQEHRSAAVALMDYGYCLTAHKAQGSEFDEVLALDEVAKIWDARRWRYTVATRAKERLTYCM
jgi:exodeoxyribonuclease-5